MKTIRHHRSAIAAGAVVAGGTLFAAGLLLACASDDAPLKTIGPEADASGDVQSDLAQPERDAGADATDAQVPDNRPPFDAAAPALNCAVTPCIKQIVAGPKNYCAVATDGVVRCWGQDSALGGFVDAAAPNRGATPVVLEGIGDVVDIAIGNSDTCVVSAAGSVSCFGSSSATPEPVPDITNAKKVAVGDSRKCAVLATGELHCWGSNYATGQTDGIVDLGGKKAIDTRSQWGSAFALATDGTLLSWGTEAYSLGRSTAISPDLVPGPVFDLPPVLQFAASDSHVCALTTTGRLFCWGRGGDNGTLGLGYVRHEFFPVEVFFAGPVYPSKVVATLTHTCARMTDGTLTCWGGMNRQGQLGYAATEGAYIPTKVSVLTKKVVDVAIADDSTCVVLDDGSVHCFGDNTAGQLGLSTRDSFRHPFPSTVVFP